MGDIITWRVINQCPCKVTPSQQSVIVCCTLSKWTNFLLPLPRYYPPSSYCYRGITVIFLPLPREYRRNFPIYRGNTAVTVVLPLSPLPCHSLPPTLLGTVIWVSAFVLSNYNKMAMMDVGTSSIQVDLRPKLLQRLAATWCRSTFIKWTEWISQYLCHDDSTINVVLTLNIVIILLLIHFLAFSANSALMSWYK